MKRLSDIIKEICPSILLEDKVYGPVYSKYWSGDDTKPDEEYEAHGFNVNKMWSTSSGITQEIHDKQHQFLEMQKAFVDKYVNFLGAHQNEPVVKKIINGFRSMADSVKKLYV